ncbi:MAG: CgeB family protein [Candidatus Cyclobacteriaceae bacterium M3_2C_046]
MKIILFYHSLLSDWNHGNAHFLRGITRELVDQGHQIQVFEPKDGWSYNNLLQKEGTYRQEEFNQYFPRITSQFHQAGLTNYEEIVKSADLVIVHEWNDPELVKHLGHLRQKHEFSLMFHDTHHRSITAPEEMAAYDLSHYDGVLAFGDVIRDIYLKNKWIEKAWTWHEAADTHLFRPHQSTQKEGDLVWIGNWGDNERTEELKEYLIDPVQELGLKATMYGVRYPPKAIKMLQEAGISYRGYIPSYKVPEVFSRYAFTVHVPRRPYAEKLTGIPTIRPFEALACGIPLISAPWKDAENLFDEGKDYLMVQNGTEMKEKMLQVLQHKALAQSLVQHGLAKIQSRHTCKIRAEELLGIYKECCELSAHEHNKALMR